ncbi:hypothetical protein ACEYYH_16805 [Microbacterium trichothecenolyticum]|uniref:hypothetical protein n=1 Tax=Microbacterium trichothecenolyticum TaxID=69370 RepID=UPI0035BE89C2
MTSTLRAVAAAAASAALLFALAACASDAPEAAPTASETQAVQVGDEACADDAGITVAVDASALEEDSKAWCIDTDETLAAADALTLVGVETEGNVEFGEDAVCRVNGVPAEDLAIPAEDGSDYFETCEAMSPAFAYWSMWVKPAGGEWGYAQEGISTLELEPGESLELLFTLNGEPAAPTS